MGKKAGVQETEDEIIIDEDVEETEETEVEDEESLDVEESEEETDQEEETEGNDSNESAQPGTSNDDDDDEVIVTIGDEEPQEDKEQAQAPEWVRELRKTHREAQRENRELKEKLQALEKPETKPVQLGPKPKLEDFDYDTEKFEEELTSWHDRKRKADEVSAEKAAEQKKAEEAWQKKLSNYGESKTKLKVKDFDDAESVVLETFNQTQQGIVIQGADNSALVIYALGKNPGKAKEIASIKDPVKFAFAVAKLEKDLKVKNRKAPPPPEKTVSGTAPKSGTVDSTLERLRAEAERTGNYSKIHKYKSQQKLKAKK